MKKWIITAYIVIVATNEVFWQLFGCQNPLNVDPYSEDYDCFQRDVYFIQSQIGHIGFFHLTHLLVKALWIKYSYITEVLLALSIGGAIDIVMLNENNNWTWIFICLGALHVGFRYAKKE